MKLPTKFGKMKTSRDHYNDWLKKLPKGTVVQSHFSDTVFVSTVTWPDFTFAYEYNDKKK